MTVDCDFFPDFNLAIYHFGGLIIVIVESKLTLVLGLGWTRIQHSMKIYFGPSTTENRCFLVHYFNIKENFKIRRDLTVS